MSSGSRSSSSENTPLLNGSHEGPCYAYSYTQSREEEYDDGEKMDSSLSGDSTLFKEKLPPLLNLIKKIFFLLLFVFCTVSLSFIDVAADVEWNSTFISRGRTNKINLTADLNIHEGIVHLRIKSPCLTEENEGASVASFSLSKLLPDGTYKKISRSWTVFVDPDIPSEVESILEHEFHLTEDEVSLNKTYQLSVTTNARYVPLSIDLSVKSKFSLKKVILAICLLVAFHILVMFKILPQTLAAMVTAITAISILAIVDQRPTLQEVICWIDMETLSLVFGILFITSMLCDTGVFELMAVMIYKLTGGHTWILLTSLFLSSALLSALLDPLTTLILMTALAIRLCEAMNIDSKHILIALVIFSNTGSIMGHTTFMKYQTAKIEYSQFALHMFPAVLMTLLAAFALWRLKYRDVALLRFKKPLEVEEVKRELEVWKKAYNSIANYSREEESVKIILERKMSALETLLRRKLYDSKISMDDYRTTLTELTNSMKKKNKYLLFKSCAIVIAVLLLLILRNVPHPLQVTSGWSAILGALCLLVLSDLDSVDSIINRVEWSTLLFLASYYLIIEALVKLDLMNYLVHEAQDFITDVDNYSLLISLIFIVWVSALSSSVALPFSAAMMGLINERYDDCAPIIFALSLGTCLGANGSLLGGTSNILTAGITEQHGFRLSYWDFFKIGFPITMLATIVSMIYLLICHIWLEWNT